MKIVPMLEENEYKRERKFYSDRGLPCPKDLALEQESEEKKAAEAEAAMTPDANTNMDFHRYDEQVQSRPIQMRIYHSNERCRISAILRHRGKLF